MLNWIYQYNSAGALKTRISIFDVISTAPGHADVYPAGIKCRLVIQLVADTCDSVLTTIRRLVPKDERFKPFR